MQVIRRIIENEQQNGKLIKFEIFKRVEVEVENKLLLFYLKEMTRKKI